MFPLIWRYFLIYYFKIVILSIGAFTAVLLVTRLDDVAHFASFNSEGIKVLLFACIQIIYVVPVALPPATLMASIILFQKLSHSRELVAFRVTGLSLRQILFPILSAGFLLSIINFYTLSELTTQSHFIATSMQNDFLSTNPITLLKNPQLIRNEKVYVCLEDTPLENKANNIFIGFYNTSQERVNLIYIKELLSIDDKLRANQVSLISSFETNSSNHYDNLIIESQEKVESLSKDFSFLINKQGWSIGAKELKSSLLLARISNFKEQRLKESLSQNRPSVIKKYTQKINHAYVAFIKRFSLGFACFTLTLLGAAYGIEIGRHQRKKGIAMAILYTIFFLISFFTAKNFSNHLILSSFLFIFPHILILLTSTITLRKVSRGIES